MTKYGRNLKFGYCLLPTATEPTRPLQLAELAETLGLNYIGIQDHDDHAEQHDIWTLLTAIGGATSRICLIAKGDDLPLRPPAALAKAAASLDLLTNGRVELDIGARAVLDVLTTAEGERRTEQEALAALEEAISVMRYVWSGERPQNFAGKFYSLDELETGLSPARHINIWLRVKEPHDLALTGRVADGWIANAYPRIQPSDLEIFDKHINEAAVAAGRDPANLHRIWKIGGKISDTESFVPFQGTAKQWAEELARRAVNAGIDTFLLSQGEDAEAQLEKFAHEVVPLVTELVALAPGTNLTSGMARAYQGAAASGATRAEEATDNVDWVDETSMESFPASDPPASSQFT